MNLFLFRENRFSQNSASADIKTARFRFLPPVIVMSLLLLMLGAYSLRESRTEVSQPTSNRLLLADGVEFATIGDDVLTIDIARMEGGGPKPALLFVHGGYWHSGSRQDERFFLRYSAKLGYVGFAPDYRLVKQDQRSGDVTAQFPAVAVGTPVAGCPPH